MYSKTNSAFNEINISLNNVYKHLNNPKTEEQGNKLFKNLISKYLFQKNLIKIWDVVVKRKKNYKLKF